MASALFEADAEHLLGVSPSRSELIALRERIAGRNWWRSGLSAPGIGVNRSPQHGRGMEFAEVRPYQPGDDVRSLDWRHTARSGRPYTKLFHEEGEWSVLLLVDMGPSMHFGTRVAFKSVQAARAAALLAWASVETGDRLGGAVWDGVGYHQLPPHGRQRGALELIRHLAGSSPAPARVGGLAAALQALARTARPGTLLVLVSDFHALDDAAEQELAKLRQRAQVSLVQVFDNFEAEAPPAAIYRVSDGEREQVLDLRTDAARAAHGAPFRQRRERLTRLAGRLSMSLLPLATHDDPILALRAIAGLNARLSG